MARRKSTIKVHRKRHPISRRQVMAALGAGAGGLLLANASRAQENDLLDDAGADPHAQWVSWDDGWAYPIWGCNKEGQWVVEFDDGFYVVDPAMWAFDSAVWYPIVEAEHGKVHYSTDDGNDWELEHELEYECLNDDCDNGNGNDV